MTGFVKPEKLVKSSADIQKWQRSDAYAVSVNVSVSLLMS